MMGSFITRGITMAFGYLYPAYECFKILERNRPNMEELKFWLQFWIIVAVITVLERISDTFISWVPMYCEAKCAFMVYLWHPKTKGTTYIYSSFLRPFLLNHETEIDRRLNELRSRALDMAVIYWQQVSAFVHSKFFEILQYLASQSTRPAAPTQSFQRPRPPSAPMPPQNDQSFQHPKAPGFQQPPGYQQPAGYQQPPGFQAPLGFQAPPPPPPPSQPPPSAPEYPVVPANSLYPPPANSLYPQITGYPHVSGNYPVAPAGTQSIQPPVINHQDSGLRLRHPRTTDNEYEIIDDAVAAETPNDMQMNGYMTRSKQKAAGNSWSN